MEGRCEGVCESVRVVLTCATKPGPSTVAPLSSGPQLQDQENVCIGSTMYPSPSTPHSSPPHSSSLTPHPSTPHPSTPHPSTPHSSLPTPSTPHPSFLTPTPHLPLLTPHPSSLTCSYRSNSYVPCVGKIFPPRYPSLCHPACVYQIPAPCKPRPLHRHH